MWAFYIAVGSQTVRMHWPMLDSKKYVTKRLLLNQTHATQWYFSRCLERIKSGECYRQCDMFCCVSAGNTYTFAAPVSRSFVNVTTNVSTTNAFLCRQSCLSNMNCLGVNHQAGICTVVWPAGNVSVTLANFQAFTLASLFGGNYVVMFSTNSCRCRFN
jgi:hypothetical protein